VVVTNEQGTVIGAGSLGLGSTSPGGDCVFSFTVADLPEALLRGGGVAPGQGDVLPCAA
jgi:hypothetical protein